jgi:hypothetical protein
MATCGGYRGQIMELNAGIYPLTSKGVNLFIEHLSETYRDLAIITPSFCHKICGIHVHLSRELFSSKEEKKFCGLFQKYEKDIFRDCVQPSRSGNMYVEPLSRWLGYEIPVNCHHVSVNCHRSQTLEVRHLGSTANLKTIKNWIFLLKVLHQISLKENYDQIVQKSETLLILLENAQAKKELAEWVQSKDPGKFSSTYLEEPELQCA